MVKTCNKCKINKLETNFAKDCTKNDGRRTICKDCSNLYYANYRKNLNKEDVKAYNKKYQLENKNKISKKQKEYRQKNKQKIALKQKEYGQKNRKELNKKYLEYKKDPNFKIACNLRSRLLIALKRNYKAGSAVKDLGCTIQEFKKYLESKFQPGMTWENYGKGGWEIDHIYPLSKVDLTDREQFLKVCHYTNLQPLWASDNRSKWTN